MTADYRRNIVWLLLELGLIITQICSTEALGPPRSRKLPLSVVHRDTGRRRIVGSASEPIVIRINKPGSRSTGRRIPNLPHAIPESSIVRLKPVIRFHIPPKNETTDTSITARQELYDTMTRMGLHRMASLLRETALDTELLKIGPVTVFAPTDDAFAVSSRGLVQSLRAGSDNTKIKEFLMNHVIRGHMYPGDVRNDFTMPTIHPSASSLRFNIYNSGQVISVSGAQFAASWTPVENILLQPVDRVIFPLPPSNLMQKIGEDFSEMHKLVRKSGLTDQLSSGTFTVFAPTNEAFSSLPLKARELLITNSTLLRKFVLNHVVPGTYFSAALSNGFQLKPLGGEILNFTVRRGLILVNGVPLINPDVSTNNGVIHATNRVLVPQELVDQCHCISKYPLAPAVLKPSTEYSSGKTPTDYLGSSREEPAFGTRLKALSPGYSYGLPENRPAEDSIVFPTDVPRKDADRPSLIQFFGQPIRLPDGRTISFNTAGQLFKKSTLFNKIRQPARNGFTILLPTDRAFRKLPAHVMDRLQRDPRRLTRVLQWHVLDGTINPKTLQNNSRLKTLSGGTLLVHVPQGGKHFPPTILVGGVRILATRSASNGAVFAVDKVFDPPPESKDVSEGMESSDAAPTHQLSLWRKIIDGLPDLKRQLKSKQEEYTMFAPTDHAFSQLSSDQLQRLLTEESLKRDLVRSHVIVGAYFRSMISPGLVLPTLMGNKLRFSQTPEGFQVNNITVNRPGILTGNGVVYVVDRLLLSLDSYSSRALVSPSEPKDIGDRSWEPFSRSLEQIARQYNATTFLKWIHASGVRNAIWNEPKCTLFLPTNKAVASLSPTLRVATVGNPKALKKLIQYHVSPVPLSSLDDIAHQDSLIPTLLQKKPIRCNIYKNKTVVTASGCPVSTVIAPDDDKISVAIVDKVLTPPVGDIFLTMSKSPMLRNFTKIVRMSGVDKELQGGGPYTLFAPTKCSFESMPPDEYEKLITEKEAARAFVMRHLVRGCIYLEGMYDGMSSPSLSGNQLHFKTSPADCVYVNGVKMKYSDLGATNGVLHIIGGFL